MVVKTYIVDKETAENLKRLDNWISKQPWDKKVELPLMMEIRELITNIETKGFYNKYEKNALNQIRKEWFKSKFENKHWTCQYCCQSTKDIEHDYLSGVDHLECVLKYEE